jgi:trans-2,3-dihydro-3-hydroxyanthranilate isomerase
MSRRYHFRIVNVFAVDSDRLSGNPLAVIENAQGLSEQEMQSLALQFNLSESTFVFAPTPDRDDREATTKANARVRIFTPTLEMPFAGHPTLGTAHVLRALGLGGDRLRLHLNVGEIPVEASGDVWTLTANAPTHRAYEHTRAQLADALGLNEDDIAGEPLWMNAGVEQLIVPLASPEAVERAKPRHDACSMYCRNFMEAQAYVFARRNESEIVSRYFFENRGALVEDPGTGSACANLGAWLLESGAAAPFSIRVYQGAATGRPCLLYLDVDTERRIHVGGRVIELMRGELELD